MKDKNYCFSITKFQTPLLILIFSIFIVPTVIYAAQNIHSNYTPVTYIEISPDNYRYNIEAVKKIIGPNVKMCLVMKSDAYGHGIDNLIREAVASGPAYIAAIYNSELRIIHEEIKKQNKDIAVLRIAPVSCDELRERIINKLDVEEIIGSFDEANMISNAAQKLSKELARDISVNVHICIETGMGRMGFRDVEEIKRSLKLPCLKLKGAMTHFANAYGKEPAGSEKTRKETEIFDNLVTSLVFDRSIVLHIANSAAAVKYPWARKDMVRVGTLTYGEDTEGLDPLNQLRPVLKAYKSKVAIIEDKVPPGSAIGYDSRQYTRDNFLSTTATIRAGYSEVIPEEAFKKNMQVLIRGKRFPAIGKSSMNMIVVDITDQDKNNPVQIDDEVVIIGQQGKEEITLEEFASKSGYTITQLTILLGNAVDKVVVD
jgi:alanine racemase